MSEKQDWFWSGNSLMNNLPDKFASEHVLVLRDDITPPSDEHKALIASAPGMAATIATQAAQIEALRDRLKEARDYVGKGFMPSGLLDRIDAALAGDKHD